MEVLTSCMKAEGCLETFNVLLSNLSILHSLKQHFPCGREALATAPFDEPSVDSFLYALRMIHETGLYCGCIKPHPFKNCTPLSCRFSAYMLSEQHEIVRTICRETDSSHS